MLACGASLEHAVRKACFQPHALICSVGCKTSLAWRLHCTVRCSKWQVAVFVAFSWPLHLSQRQSWTGRALSCPGWWRRMVFSCYHCLSMSASCLIMFVLMSYTHPIRSTWFAFNWLTNSLKSWARRMFGLPSRTSTNQQCRYGIINSSLAGVPVRRSRPGSPSTQPMCCKLMLICGQS